MRPLAVLAFGGNALLKSNQKGTYEEQFQNVENTCRQIVPLIRRGYDIVICHGNGPQVGNVMLQHEAGRNIFGLQQMPMDFCGAETQGAIAYMIETAMDRVLYANGITRRVISLVTRVEVSPKDPMFQNPTKPVGPFYTAEEAQRLAAETGAVYKEDPQGRGWRKVVPSRRRSISPTPTWSAGWPGRGRSSSPAGAAASRSSGRTAATGAWRP